MNMLHLKRKMMKSVLAGLLVAMAMPALAQTEKYKNYKEVYRDTTYTELPTQTLVKTDTVLNAQRVLTNKFWSNWFVFGTVGAHSFRGELSNYGKFSDTVSPDWSVGFGKWITPFVGLKAEFIGSNSKGYTDIKPIWGANKYYGYGDILTDSKGAKAKKMRTGWWDISVNAMFNLSRLLYGYEGANTHKRMNQFIFNIGLGGTHHLGYDKGGSDNEWSGHLELQYSRFLTRSKRLSLDAKLRGLFYETNFDGIYGVNEDAHKWDANLGFDFGFTYHLGKKENIGWNQSVQTVYQRDYRERRILVVKEAPARNVKYNSITFYVFYPNNYSGRNDAPLVKTSKVNALDYLAGGIFTQKQYVNAKDVEDRFAKNVSLDGLEVKDIPTEYADNDFKVNYVPRGYEMSRTQPLSLSLKASDMTTFKNKAGYYYAPIFDGQHNWQYRIDKETEGQRLLNEDNYKETATYALNAHDGIKTIRERMSIEDGEELVSFADVYAAMRSNNGYISQFTDNATVERIRQILDQGSITMIQAEGLATSQDNFTGANAEKVGRDRNTTLSQNRAATVISWLKGKERLKDVASQIYMVSDLKGQVRSVNDKSTRGLNAKLNRCVKVRISYLLK